jgi:hypothetical protein
MIRDINSNSGTLELNNCVILNLRAGNRFVSGGFNMTGDNCVFMSANPDNEVQISQNSGRSLSALQADTGAFSNSVYLTHDQYRNFMQGDWRKGDVRINSNADVTAADGTVYTGQLPDGTSLSQIGVQKSWDYTSRTSQDGAPSQWPTPPTTETESINYVEDPDNWNWSDTPIITHESSTNLGSRLTAYWAMDGSAGANEPDTIGSNDLVQYGSVGSGSNSDFSYRTFDTSKRLEVGSPDTELENPLRFWLAVPLRPDDLASELDKIVKFSNNKGYRIEQDDSGNLKLSFPTLSDPGLSSVFSVTQGQFVVVQLWQDPVAGERGLRVGSSEITGDWVYHRRMTTEAEPFYVGGDGRSARSFTGAVGPLMIADIAPSQADRDWIENSGSFRTLSEIQNRTITFKEI